MRSVSEAEMETYRQTARRRQAEKEEAVANRVVQAQSVLNEATTWLRKTYDIEKIWLFGSLVHQQWFTMTSDIDLAVVSLSPDDYLTAIDGLQGISPDFKIDLVQLNKIPESFKAAILSEGKAV